MEVSSARLQTLTEKPARVRVCASVGVCINTRPHVGTDSSGNRKWKESPHGVFCTSLILLKFLKHFHVSHFCEHSPLTLTWPVCVCGLIVHMCVYFLWFPEAVWCCPVTVFIRLPLPLCSGPAANLANSAGEFISEYCMCTCMCMCWTFLAPVVS